MFHLATFFGLLSICAAYQISPFISDGIPSNWNVEMEPFVQLGKSFYYFEKNIRTNWFDAYEKCRKMGAELVTFETEEEWNYITKYLTDNNERSEHWTSGSDLAKTGTHNWFSNGKAIAINKWAKNQPDNSGGIEHCIHLGYIYTDSTNIELNDRPCNNDNNSLFHFICELPSPQTASFIVWN